MRIGLDTRRSVLFGAMLAIMLVIFLPLRLVLGAVAAGDSGLSARAAAGSAWSGRLLDARLGDVALGDLRAGVSPLQLLLGRARIDLATESDGWSGGFTVSRHSVGVDDLSGTIAGAPFAALPIGGLSFDDVSIRFRDGACDAASGRVRATVTGAAAALAQSLAGGVRCDGQAALLPLASTAGDARADVRLFADGRYTAALSGVGQTAAITGRLR